jgi:hypothetical protein
MLDRSELKFNFPRQNFQSYIKMCSVMTDRFAQYSLILRKEHIVACNCRNSCLTRNNGLTGMLCFLRGPCDSYVTQQ